MSTRYCLTLPLMMLFPSIAQASYRDGFFGMGIVFFATPVMLVAVIVTLYYCNRKWFYDKTFTVVYCAAWLVFFIAATLLTTSVSVSNSDAESANIIVIGLTVLYCIVIAPAVVQYKTRHR